MSTNETRNTGQTRRIQLILGLMIGWELLTLLAELSFGSLLFKVGNDEIGGLLAGRSGFGGANIVPAVLYIYAFVRGPMRYKGVLWLGVLQNAVTILLCVFHVSTGNLDFENVLITFVVSIGFAVALLINMPRGQAT